METITQNYTKLLKNMIISQFNDKLSKEIDKNLTRNNVFNYIDILSNLESSLIEVAKESLVAIFEAIDRSYANSIERKSKYHIRAHEYRTILTIFGEITFKRTFYSRKDKTGCYCYLDNYLGLAKHDYFDPYIKSTILEYAANNSAPTVCKIMNDLVGNRIVINEKPYLFSRQIIRNIILESTLSTPEIETNDTPETIYIMADEKWVHTQNNNGMDVMVKSIVVFDRIENGKIINKKIFSDYKKNPLISCLDYINIKYDVNKIKNVFLMGDGANWIKNLRFDFKFTSDTIVTYALDKYHFKQALHHIFLIKDIEDYVSSVIIKNHRKDFKQIIKDFLIAHPERKKTITDKSEYIFNNWNYIQNLYKYNLSCPMESQISHNLAALLTARPKGYSLKTLDNILNLRMLYKNNENIKLLTLNNYNINETKQINSNEFYYDLNDRKKTPYSTNTLAIFSFFNRNNSYFC